MLDKEIEAEHLCWSKSVKRFVPRDECDVGEKCPKKFLKGPIPWSWMEEAAKLPGKALEVGLCVWRLSGVMKSDVVKLSTNEVAALGVSRHAKSRALKHLESAGLIGVERHQGRFPLVKLKKNYMQKGRYPKSSKSRPATMG